MTVRRRSSPALISALALAAFCLLSIGCGGYTMRGRVVRGEMSMITLVEPDDPVLRMGEGIPQADIRFYRDPERLSRELTGSAMSREDGSFAAPVSGFGAGWMDEMWEIRATAPKHHRAETLLRLPSNAGKMVLLIILAPGRDGPEANDEDLLREFEQYR